VSIAIMELIDNLTIALVPGALEAGLGDLRFWLPLLGGFVIAWPFAFRGEPGDDPPREGSRGRARVPPLTRSSHNLTALAAKIGAERISAQGATQPE
jgi:hypothetical protein